MSDYVPTIDEVRDRYADARVGIGEWTRFDESVNLAVEEAYAEFDRMIAEVERAAAERALEGAAEDVEGIKNAARDGMNKFGPYPWHAAEGVADWLRARAAEIREGK